ncbi:MAG: hypothetical protein M1838_004198 [Thelocarpon superellum]|nr:MAG: hypothetical protein M1838_004198 [Thelocarpon superellum]
MVSDAVYELCLPILQDASLEEEDKTDKLEDLLGKETTLAGSARENAVLGVLWRFRDAASVGSGSASSSPIRHTILRRPSPASWQLPRGSTPTASSPGLSRTIQTPPGFGVAPPAFTRARSSAASPFTSPRPSPRPAFSSPRIPHSPNLNAYEFPTETTPAADVHEGYASDNVDWLVNDDSASVASSLGGTPANESNLNGGAAAFVQPQQVDMSPYDILRSVMGEGKSDEDIERALEMNGYDLSATILNLMDDHSAESLPNSAGAVDEAGTVLVGKSMGPGPQRPVTPASQQRSGILCRFWLSTGTCLRADCRFSHDLSTHVCKYWVMGSCLAGDTCVFSHDPSTLLSRLAVDEKNNPTTPPPMQVQPNFQIQDYQSFPSLQSLSPDQWPSAYETANTTLPYPSMYGAETFGGAPPAVMGQSPLGSDRSLRNNSRPGSRGNLHEGVPGVPAVDDTEAFPSLSTMSTKTGKKHHGKRGGHGHGPREKKEHKDSASSSLADVARISPQRNVKSSKAATIIRKNSATALAIPPPQHIPWLKTADRANKAYLKLRHEAIKHGGLRNKFLQR